MTTVKASASKIIAEVRAQMARDAKAAAGNKLLSKAEQKKLADGVLRETAESIRAAGGARRRVSTDELVEVATGRVASLLGQVNQASGTGAALVSQSEVRDLARLHSDVGVRVAKAYEVITGKRIALPVTTPTTPAVGPIDFENTLISAAQAQAILTLVNTTSPSALDAVPQLDRRAAASIVANRPLQTIHDLSRLPWIGPSAAQVLMQFLQNRGMWPN